MLESTIVAFTTFFATIGPVDVAAMFAALGTREIGVVGEEEDLQIASFLWPW